MTSRALIPFLVFMMLLTGVCNTLLNKYQDMQCVADCDSKQPKKFEQPVLQTLQMFIGESGCWIVVFVGYLLKRFRNSIATTPAQHLEYERIETADPDEAGNFGEDEDISEDMTSSQTLIDPTNIVAKPLIDGAEIVAERKPLQGFKIAILALPAMCDILGTTLMNVGLLFVAASIYQMTRGALVLFVGLFSVIFLKKHVQAWKWASLFVVVLGVAIVGLAGALDSSRNVADPSDFSPNEYFADLKSLMFRSSTKKVLSSLEVHTAAETILGILMIAGAQIFTASQFVLEESIMERYAMDPLQVVGWEGTFGFVVTLISMIVLHLLIGRTPLGQGGYFDAREGLRNLSENRAIAVSSVLIMISIGGFNFFGLSVTRMISATSRSTIDTCRTLFIWLASLGLAWESFKWLQVLGFALLVWGTAIFNEIIQPPTIAAFRRLSNRTSRIARREG